MNMNHILGVIGGLSLFLFGMKMMSDGLENMAGHRLEIILQKMTNHKIKAVLIGTLITCLIQSSSAMTIILIGFVNAKVMKLDNAIWVVMGANIGTTITGQMIALNIGGIAPILSLVGVIFIVFFIKDIYQNIGSVLTGLGLLFMGLEMMSILLLPLQDNPYFIHLMTTLSHPLLAILFGTLFCALIQSSSASLGILQTLSMQGFVPFETGVCMIYGFNIGTCMTSFLASLSSCRNAKRLTYFHILLNIIGVIVFYIVSCFMPILSWIQMLASNSIMMQLAHFHTIFNIVSTFIVLPFDHYFIKFIYRLIPMKEYE